MRKGKTLLLGSVCVLLAIFRGPAAKAADVPMHNAGNTFAVAVVAAR